MLRDCNCNHLYPLKIIYQDSHMVIFKSRVKITKQEKPERNDFFLGVNL